MIYTVKRIAHLPDRIGQAVLTFAGAPGGHGDSLGQVAQAMRESFPGWTVEGTGFTVTLRRHPRDPISLEVSE